ncbi:MAG: LamG-like jellyroll fold domain-containing protein, partial [Chthoniobacteraceae bacterium]
SCSEEARRFYVRTMAMSASLFAYAAEMQSDAPEPLNVIRPARWRRWLGPLAAAAVIIAGIALTRFFQTGEGLESAADAVETIARLSGSKDCKWLASGPAPGDELMRGQKLELLSGFAEVTFDSGAQLLLEGPVSLELRSAWDAELHRGTLKANVPPEAIGFRVASAAVEVVDLGTEFSMTADDAGVAEVFVLKGAVEVHPRDAGGNLMTKSVLNEKQARRFAKAGAGDVRDGEHKFQRFARKVAIERLVRPMNYVWWSFDEGEGSVAASSSNLAGDASLGIGKSDPAGPRWAGGKWGAALLFEGEGGAGVKLPNPIGRNARTVAFWVRIAGDSPLSDTGPFVTVPVNRAGQSWAEFAGNRLPAEGVLGALRMQTGSASVVGTTPMRDGKWHHVAAVFGLSGKSAGKLHSKVYVDGRLEPLSGRMLGRRVIGKLPGELDGTLWLGARPGGGGRTHAAIDELLVADRAMAPQEIKHLMRTNSLMSPEALAAN